VYVAEMVDAKNAQNCDEKASSETTSRNGRRWENNKKDLRGMGNEDGGRWVDLTLDRVQ
jgi:hypothetical protein